MQQLKLTNSDKVALISDEDYPRIISLGLRWRLAKKHVLATQTYVRFNNVFTRHVLLHREIMGLRKDCDIQIDHKDHDILNNTRENLRLCSRSQNMMNRTSSGTSGYKGVSWHKQIKLWQVKIGINKQRIHCGYFKTKEEAAVKYNEVAGKLHGEFALLNEVIY